MAQIDVIQDGVYKGLKGLIKVLPSDVKWGGVTIPDDIQVIAPHAFDGLSKLEVVKFKKGSKLQSINKDAFTNCENLTKIVFPKQAFYLDKNAFIGCDNISKVEINDEMANYFSSLFQTNVFRIDYHDLKNIESEFLSEKQKKKISAIGFSKIENVEIPKGLFENTKLILLSEDAFISGNIGDSAFKNAFFDIWGTFRSKTLTIGPNSVIGENAFAEFNVLNKITKQEYDLDIKFGENSIINKNAFNDAYLPNVKIHIGENTNIGDFAFQGVESKYVIIHDNCSFGDYCFDPFSENANRKTRPQLLFFAGKVKSFNKKSFVGKTLQRLNNGEVKEREYPIYKFIGFRANGGIFLSDRVDKSLNAKWQPISAKTSDQYYEILQSILLKEPKKTKEGDGSQIEM